MEISSHSQIQPKLGSLNSGSASYSECGSAFPDELLVKVAKKINSGQENSSSAPAKIWTHNLSLMNLVLFLSYPQPLKAHSKQW